MITAPCGVWRPEVHYSYNLIEYYVKPLRSSHTHTDQLISMLQLLQQGPAPAEGSIAEDGEENKWDDTPTFSDLP